MLSEYCRSVGLEDPPRGSAAEVLIVHRQDDAVWTRLDGLWLPTRFLWEARAAMWDTVMEMCQAAEQEMVGSVGVVN